MEKLPLSGISFDVENTLLAYNDPVGGDAANYAAAVDAYNLQVATQSEEFHPTPSWQGSLERRKAALGAAWVAAQTEIAALMSTPEDKHLWDAELKVPWGHDADGFFHRVCDLYFEVACPAPFVKYLVHTYYISPAVYHLPPHAHLLLELRKRHPQLPLVIVSNTDARVVLATRMFDVYASIFPEDVFFHASSLPEIKPSPKAIAIAAESVGVVKLHRWLHVGDDSADRRAAEASGCLFYPCDKSVGLDFPSFLDFVEEHM